MIREVKFAKCPHCKAEHRVFDGNLTEEHSPEYVKRNCRNCGKEFWLVATQIMKFTALKPPRKQKPEPSGEDKKRMCKHSCVIDCVCLACGMNFREVEG